MRTTLLIVLLAAVVALSRVPFLSAGYGENVDAWRVARAARHIARTHVYEVSRFPGYPVQEITCAFVRGFGAVGLNALSALFSVAAVVAAWLIARRLECRDAVLLALALAATPVFFLNSVTAKDYVWAIAFVLWAFYAALECRSILCGVLLGLAIGCRITSGAMIIPLAMVLSGSAERKSWRAVIIPFGLCAGFTAALMFLPVWIRYGREFFTFYDAHDRPDAATILLRGSTEVWGALGLAGLAIVIVGAILRGRFALPASMPRPANRFVVPGLVVTVLLYLLAYLRLPDQAGYLIPMVPAVLLLASRFAPRLAFQIACVCLLLAPWIDFSQGRIAAGAIIADQRMRRQTLQDVERFVLMTEQVLPGENTVVVGAWEPIISELPIAATAHNDYVYLLSAAEMEQLVRDGRSVAYASDTIRAFNLRVGKIDLAEYGARNVRQILLGKP